jgi:hypothetical protein
MSDTKTDEKTKPERPFVHLPENKLPHNCLNLKEIHDVEQITKQQIGKSWRKATDGSNDTPTEFWFALAWVHAKREAEHFKLKFEDVATGALGDLEDVQYYLLKEVNERLDEERKKLEEAEAADAAEAVNANDAA